MAIPVELEFSGRQKEFEFRDKFVLPLLVRLGFGVVANYHGQREFGRDVVFADIDRFGHVVYYGMQIKYEASISLANSQGLIDDAEQATHNSFTHPQTGRTEYISCFYVVNAGDISEPARANFFATVVRKGVRDARLLDGNALLLLDKSAALNRAGHLQERLAGMLQEIRRNKNIVPGLAAALEGYAAEPERGAFPLLRCRNIAMAHHLGAPFPIPGLALDVIDQYWESIRILNDIADSVGVPVVVSAFRSGRAKAFGELCPQTLMLGEQIELAVVATLSDLGSQAGRR